MNTGKDKLIDELEQKSAMYQEMFDASCEDRKLLVLELNQAERELKIANSKIKAMEVQG